MDRTLLDRIRTLEAENAELKKALQSKGQADPSPGKLAKACEDLESSNKRLKENLKKCQAKAERARETAQAAKQIVKQWQAFYDHQARKLERAGLRVVSQLVARSSSPQADEEDQNPTPRPLPARNALAGGDVSPSEQDEGAKSSPSHAHLESTHLIEAPATRARRVTSSQTTEDGAELATADDTRISSDDEPEFVSARPVKRRRGNSPRTTKASTQIKLEPTSPTEPHEINSEDFSSPIRQRRQPLRRETSNLDAIMSAITSPSKRRGRRAASASAEAAPRMPTTMSSLSENDVQDAPRADQETRSETSHGPTQVSAGRNTHRIQHAEGSDLSKRALQPLSTNISGSPRRALDGNTKRKRRDEDPKTSTAKAAIVSEDGDMDSSQVDQADSRTSSKAAVNRRLDSLLDGPTPGRQEIGRRVITPGAKRSRPAQKQAKPPDSGDADFNAALKTSNAEQRPAFKTPNLPLKPRRPAATTTARRRPQPDSSPPLPDPEDEPLRARPIVRLRLEDFKINPKYQGTNFAFADTLRGREQRRCLPGCTRPECCGDAFRKAAEMGFPGGKTDEEMLERYLGPAYASHMASRTPAERKDLLTKARTYAIASEHGKHRSAFKRRTTPPGFWRIDMASTQEEQEDRAKAEDMVRQEVYERWLEAVKPNGRYKFRDE